MNSSETGKLLKPEEECGRESVVWERVVEVGMVVVGGRRAAGGGGGAGSGPAWCQAIAPGPGRAAPALTAGALRS